MMFLTDGGWMPQARPLLWLTLAGLAVLTVSARTSMAPGPAQSQQAGSPAARSAHGSAAPASTAPAAAAGRLAALVPKIEHNLRENVLHFWFPRTVDRVNGGYTIHYGPSGEALPGGTKMIVTQARMLWLSARLLRSRFTDPAYRDAADIGFRFLRDRMWDREHGGFYWEVDPTGRTVLKPLKHLYGQAFGLYALSEYALATHNREALDLANRLFDLLDAKAYDKQYGGYREFFARDWSAAPASESSYLGGPRDAKLMNTHLHLLEAMTAYVRASGRPVAKERLAELIAIQTQAVVRKGWVGCTDQYQRDWTPILTDATSRVSYGHDLENIWLVDDALQALDRPGAPYHDLFRELFTNAATYGFDGAHGGFFESGPPHTAADRRGKVWWVQAEALVSALTMFKLTGDARYADIFERTWTWVDTRQTDWTGGEWFEVIGADDRPGTGNKATPWKAAYHNGRALLESLDRIAALSAPAPPASVGAAAAPAKAR
jgi:mannose/cellobiose epimerase-like protein (N-acyl-D-glucosamine 2-epimerase family)